MRSLLVAATLVLGTAVVPAQAAEWMMVAHGTKTMVFVDAGSVTRSDDGKRATATMMTTFATALLGKYWSETMTVEYDCATPRYREAANVIFTDQKGEVLLRSDGDQPEEWTPVRHGTVDDGTREYVCFGRRAEGPSADPLADSKERFGW